MKKLRIALMVSASFTTPPPKGIVYAPMDIAISIAQGLAKRGHKIDFYAVKESKIPDINIVHENLRVLKQKNDKLLEQPAVRGTERFKIFNLWDQYLIAAMFRNFKKRKYDLLHIHPVDRALPLAFSHPEMPVVYTLHDPIFPWRAEIFKIFSSRNQYYISISDNQRRPAPNLNYIDTIYNGVDLVQFPYSEKSEDYFLWLGRFTPDKGPAEAIQAARLANKKLILIGPKGNGNYWEKKIKPYLNNQIKYLGFIPREKLYKYYQKAKATLVPIKWEEPFGLIMTESMACGTPVIAFNRGSVPEIIKDGKTGFIVNNIKEMVRAIKRVDEISRQACHKHTEKNFSLEKMIDNYEKVFLKIYEKNRKK